ncbi:MAG: undecaprenyl-diphosphatase UppP [Candidatus Dojkabacteria bacterium]
MSILEAIILGFVQGLTEFLPVSSSGHLVIFSHLLDLDLTSDSYTAFFATLHIGTLIAVFVYYREKIKTLINTQAKQRNLFFLKLIIVSLPVITFGAIYAVFIQSQISKENILVLACVSLIISGMFFIASELIVRNFSNFISFETSGLWRIAAIGFFQAIAILPGVSRSGVTITGGRILKLKKEDALDFAFIISIPVILLAGIFSLVEARGELFQKEVLLPSLAGITASAFVGYFAIKFLIDFLKKYSIIYFGIYCILLGIFVLIFR